MQPFIQSKIKLTKEQLEILSSWTADMNGDSKKFFIHVLMCHKQSRLKHDYEEWRGVPVPRKRFIHEFCREYRWDDVKHLMKRAPYSMADGVSFRYRIHEDLVEQFVEAGQEQLLSLQRCMEGYFYNAEGEKLGKLIKPFNGKEPCQVDVQAATWKLRHEKQKWEAETDAATKSKLYRRWLHNMNCFQGIMERVVKINYQKKYVWYSQELKQPDEGLRFYEVGGGLQCASSDFREYLLVTSPVINVDVVKCHPNIALMSMRKMGIESMTLARLIEGQLYIPGCKLRVKTIKTAMCAIINGARRVYKLNPRYSLPRLVLEDASVREEDKSKQLKILLDHLKRLEDDIKLWAKTLPKHEKIAKVSAFLQQQEVERLQGLKDLQVNDQHDGALISYKDEVPQGIGLHVVPKPISKAEQPEFIPMEAIQGNFADAVMAMGARVEACGKEPSFFYSKMTGVQVAKAPTNTTHTHKNTSEDSTSCSSYDFQSLSSISIL